MGEIADEMINRYLDNPDMYYENDEEVSESFDRPHKPTCKYCERKNLVWEQTPSGWRLMNPDGSLHRCIDPFEEVKRVESKIQAKQVRDESRSRRTGTHLGKTPNKRRTTLER